MRNNPHLFYSVMCSTNGYNNCLQSFTYTFIGLVEFLRDTRTLARNSVERVYFILQALPAYLLFLLLYSLYLYPGTCLTRFLVSFNNSTKTTTPPTEHPETSSCNHDQGERIAIKYSVQKNSYFVEYKCCNCIVVKRVLITDLPDFLSGHRLTTSSKSSKLNSVGVNHNGKFT